MLIVLILFTFVDLALADEPIIQLHAKCPDKFSQTPSLHLTADVPAYAMAKCRNGDKDLTETDEVNFVLLGSFDLSYIGANCQFYQKDGSNTFTVDVEVGWGEKNSQVIQQRKIHTISCAYDDHGRAVSSEETVTDWFLNPWEAQTLLGGNSTGNFVLRVIDVLGKEILTDHISVGRKIRLLAEDVSGQGLTFRALSCSAQNSVNRFYVLRAGCGDGLVFPKTSGFITQGREVLSPYFDAFKLSGRDNTVQFQCRFTECDGPCDGDSCSVLPGTVQARRRRAESLPESIVLSTSRSFRL